MYVDTRTELNHPLETLDAEKPQKALNSLHDDSAQDLIALGHGANFRAVDQKYYQTYPDDSGFLQNNPYFTETQVLQYKDGRYLVSIRSFLTVVVGLSMYESLRTAIRMHSITLSILDPSK